jgi:acetyl esterase/lipase
MTHNACISLLGFLIISMQTLAQQESPLYQGPIPNSTPVKNEEVAEERNGVMIVSKISVPTLTAFLPSPEKSNGLAVVICPGGGYWVNAISHEGWDVARKLNEWGIAAFVLKYRIPDDHMAERKWGPLQDAQQAIATVRANAGKYNIDPDRIGIMGFSAGGHLASTAGTHFTTPVVPQAVGVRPDFMILVYPVISFQPEIAHMGSREQLVGKDASKEDVDLFSNELQITDQTPPAFLIHAADDDAVKVANSIRFFEALNQHKIPVELHVYQQGGHGFGMNNRFTNEQWIESCRNWLEANNWFKVK